MKIVKNKHAPPFRQAEFELEFGKGISRESEIIELGVKHKLIRKNGAFFYLNDDESPIRGKEAFKAHLAANESVREELIVKLREKLTDSGATEETDEEAVDEVASAPSTSVEDVASDTLEEATAAEA